MDPIFTTFTTDDILKGNTWKGKEMPQETLEALKTQAASLSDSLLWKVLKSELEWFAVKSLLENGKDADDIRFAQLLGNMTQVIDGKLKSLAH